MLYALCAILSLFLGYWMRELVQLLIRIENTLHGLVRASETIEKVKEVPKVGFAEPKTPVEFLAEQEAERIRNMNR